MFRSRLLLVLGRCRSAWLGSSPASTRATVAVRVSIPGPDSVETPVTGIGLVALPYDRDSVLAAWRAAPDRPARTRPSCSASSASSAAPSPPTPRRPSPPARLRDSLERLKARLDSLPRGSDEYRERYAVFGRLNDSLVALQGRAEQRRAELDRARAAFVERSETLRAAIRHWEDSTYQGYDSLTDALAAQRHREPVTDTTGATAGPTSPSTAAPGGSTADRGMPPIPTPSGIGTSR